MKGQVKLSMVTPRKDLSSPLNNEKHHIALCSALVLHIARTCLLPQVSLKRALFPLIRQNESFNGKTNIKIFQQKVSPVFGKKKVTEETC